MTKNPDLITHPHPISMRHQMGNAMETYVNKSLRNIRMKRLNRARVDAERRKRGVRIPTSKKEVVNADS